MKLPPFGKSVPENCLEVYLFIGKKSWGRAMGMQSCREGALCLPPNVSPYDYSWPVSGKEVLVFDTGWSNEDYIFEVITCLFSNGATVIRVIDQNDKLSVFKKEI